MNIKKCEGIVIVVFKFMEILFYLVTRYIGFRGKKLKGLIDLFVFNIRNIIIKVFFHSLSIQYRQPVLQREVIIV